MSFLQPGRVRRWLVFVAGIGALMPGLVTAAPKTDLIVLVNGDRITGEIKGLEHNRLRFSTEHMGTVAIEWDKIAQLQSDQYLLLEGPDGSRHYGQLLEGAGAAELRVRRNSSARVETVTMASVVRAEPILGGDFVDRLDGYVSAGFDTVKANDRRSFDFAGGLSSRTRVREWQLDASANLTDDNAEETSERYQLHGSWHQFRRNRDFYLGFTTLDRNSELDLDLRTQLGLGYGRYLVQSNSAEWVTGAGLALTHENYSRGENTDSFEAFLSTQFSIFRYDFPETDIGGSFSLLPSLTESGRVRAEGDLRARYEFVDDLYFELKLYGSYDSEPPLEGSERSDYGVVTSLGYSF
ncbi:MAG: DUF481 domain-containing protein [Steroidobacteraceae bacterium]